MLHARIARFDVMSTVALFRKTFRGLNMGKSTINVGKYTTIA